MPKQLWKMRFQIPAEELHTWHEIQGTDQTFVAQPPDGHFDLIQGKGWRIDLGLNIL